MRLLLAPMEGLLDEALRAELTSTACYDHAVSEFVRITATVLPLRYFRRVVPELSVGSRTAAGTPVHVQLLGSDPDSMAANAARLATIAPAGVDLNFGCPAPTVNRHRGGAVLLDEPELLYRIVAAVRNALPAQVPLSAKMRLGMRDCSRTLECAQALCAGGAGSLVVHARTRLDGYRPPARWEWIARIDEAVSVPVVANGEIWTVADWQRCREISGVADVMLGRGAVADPFLATRIRGGRFEALDPRQRAEEWAQLQVLLGRFHARVKARVEARHVPGRIKQWLRMLARNYGNYDEAAQLFASIRQSSTLAAFEAGLASHGVPVIQGERAGRMEKSA